MLATQRLLRCAAALLLSTTASLAGEANVVDDGAHGPARLAGRLIVRHGPGVPRHAVAAALAANGARTIAALAALDAAVVELSEESLPRVERKLREAGVFRSVERDYLARIAELPNDPYVGAQWGLSH